MAGSFLEIIGKIALSVVGSVINSASNGVSDYEKKVNEYERKVNQYENGSPNSD